MRFKSPYRFPYNFREDYLRPSHYYYYVKNVIQRIQYGVSQSDEFSLDYHLAHILLYSLPKFKNDGIYGETVIFETAAASSFGTSWTPEKEVQQKENMDTWDAMIDAIWSAIYDQYDDDADMALQFSEEAGERFILSMALFGENMRGLWW